MTKDEMQNMIKSIITAKNKNGFEIFTCIRCNIGYVLKKLRSTDSLRYSAEEKILSILEQKYLDEAVEYETSENIADNKKALYEVQQDNDYFPFEFLKDYRNVTETFKDTDRKSLIGFFFRINLNEDYFWAYQHIYSVARIDRSKHVFALFQKDTYDEIDGDILQIDSRADLVIIGDVIVTPKIDLLERFFSLEKYIRAGAQATLKRIEEMDIVDGFEKVIALEQKSKLTNAKKLLKATNSSVLTMDRETLIKNLRAHSRYSTMFKFENDHIVISSQKIAAAFIKMLNDDILRSELTGKEYDSPSKSRLDTEEEQRIERKVL